MSKRDLRDEVSQVLCRVCEMSLRNGNELVSSVAQEALLTADGEIGIGPGDEGCPMGGGGVSDCPLVRKPAS